MRVPAGVAAAFTTGTMTCGATLGGTLTIVPVTVKLPVTLNGTIPPEDVDAFSF